MSKHSQVLPVQERDLEELARFRLNPSVNNHNPVAKTVFSLSQDTNLRRAGQMEEQDRVNMKDPRSISRYVCLKAAGDGGEIVGYALWSFFLNSAEETVESGYYTPWLADAEVDALQVLESNARWRRYEAVGGKSFAFLCNLCTSTDDDKEAATQLLAWGLSLAEAHHLPSYVEVDDRSHDVYFQHSFQAVSDFAIDLHLLGAPTQRGTGMIRPAIQDLDLCSPIAVCPVLSNTDFGSFPEIEHSAFGLSPLSQLMYPRDPNSSDTTNASATTLEHAITLATDPTVHYLKAFDILEPYRLIGWARWNLYRRPNTPPPFSLQTPSPDTRTNLPLTNHFFAALSAKRDEYMRDRPYLFLPVLVVRPECQRRGVGTKLLQYGVKLADDQGVPCWVDSSPEGLELYKRLGWKEVAETEIEFGRWGGKEGEKDVTVHLVREPGQPSLSRD